MSARRVVWVGLLWCGCVGLAFDASESSAPVPVAPEGIVDGGSFIAVFDAGPLDVDGGEQADAGGGARDAGPSGALDAGRGCPDGSTCQTFESAALGPLASGATSQGWTADVWGSRTRFGVETGRAFSGQRALHVHVPAGESGGGQLLWRGAPLVPAGEVLHARAMVFLERPASSAHWNLLRASGLVPDGPTAGHRAAYLASVSTPRTFMAVYFDDQTFQDCWSHGTETLPVGRWACLRFSVDARAIDVRLTLEERAAFSVQTMGMGCNRPNERWYGPRFDALHVGAMSYHPFDADLDLWVDDVVVSATPVSCP